MKLLWKLAIAGAISSTMSIANGTVITGVDLLTMEGAGVTFPNNSPILNGSSLVFEGNDSLQTLLDYELGVETTFSLSIDLTRLECLGNSCVGGASDSDAHLLISDGTWMFGVVFADNDGGQFLAADLYIPQGARSLTTLTSGVGYPSIDSSVSINLNFLLTSTSTTVEASAFGTTATFTWQQALSADNLSFLLLQDNDSGERYQLNSLTFPPAAIPEPGTLALLAIGLAGMGLARRSKKTQSAYTAYRNPA